MIGDAIAATAVPAPLIRVRWRVFACIFAATIVALAQRTSISVTAEQMMPALGLTQAQMAWLFTAFLVGYTAFQFPGGLFGQRVGAHRGLLASVLLSSIGTAMTAATPLIGTGVVLIGFLIASRFITGVAQAPLFPISSGAVQAWFAPDRWASMFGLQITGLSLGAAAAPPTIAVLMQAFGWEAALYAVALPGVAVAAIWAWYARDTPQKHPAMTPAELQEIRPGRHAAGEPVRVRDALRVLADTRVLLLSASYVLYGVVYYLFVFWTFLYLVQERGFSVLQGGWLASVPFIVGAFGAAIGGRASDALCRRFGPRWGFRIVPLVVLPAAAALLLLGVSVPDPYVAVAVLSICFGTATMIEGPLWGAMMWATRERSMAGGGVLNTGGNIGGIIGTPIIGYLTGAGNWTGAFVLGAGCALAAAAVWLCIDVTRGAPAGGAPAISRIDE
jgi:MFS transporter, ACS family, glucarate transporter